MSNCEEGTSGGVFWMFTAILVLVVKGALLRHEQQFICEQQFTHDQVLGRLANGHVRFAPFAIGVVKVLLFPSGPRLVM